MKKRCGWVRSWRRAEGLGLRVSPCSHWGTVGHGSCECGRRGLLGLHHAVCSIESSFSLCAMRGYKGLWGLHLKADYFHVQQEAFCGKCQGCLLRWLCMLYYLLQSPGQAWCALEFCRNRNVRIHHHPSHTVSLGALVDVPFLSSPLVPLPSLRKMKMQGISHGLRILRTTVKYGARWIYIFFSWRQNIACLC